jgi:hypothetical protein
MAEAPYLIALALLEQNGQRAMPVHGKSLRESIPAGADPGQDGRDIALELLVRVWQRTEDAPLQRAAGDNSLLLLALPLELMQEQIPTLKAAWLAGGSTVALLAQLNAAAGTVWSLTFERYQPLRFTPLS